MSVAENKVVQVRYTLRDTAGKILDASGEEPLEYLHGHRNIIPGLEKNLTGLAPGAKTQVKVPPEEAYGPYRPELKFSIGLDRFGEDKPEAGQMAQMTAEDGGMAMATVLEVTETTVTLDANHPLAGQELHFEVEIAGIRDASEEELAHGHPHGPGGHHHGHDHDHDHAHGEHCHHGHDHSHEHGHDHGHQHGEHCHHGHEHHKH